MSGNTMRGTPTRNQGRGNIPFASSPATSGIPRPAGEPQPSEAGSAVSASRQKQTKRDEVRISTTRSLAITSCGCSNAIIRAA